jgi:hypothetical protein
MRIQTLKLLSSHIHYQNCRATQDPHNMTAALLPFNTSFTRTYLTEEIIGSYTEQVVQ